MAPAFITIIINRLYLSTAEGDSTNNSNDHDDGPCLQNTIIIATSSSLFCALVFTIIGLFCGIYIRSKRIDNRGTIAAVNLVPMYEDITLNVAPLKQLNAEKLQVSENMAYGN